MHPRSRKEKDSIAQSVEHITFNDGVLGSSPSRVTNFRPKGLGEKFIPNSEAGGKPQSGHKFCGLHIIILNQRLDSSVGRAHHF